MSDLEIPDVSRSPRLHAYTGMWRLHLDHVVPLVTPTAAAAGHRGGGDHRRRHHGRQHRLPPGRGRRTRRRADRARQPRLGLLRQAARRGPRDLLRPRQHPARAAQPAGLRALRPRVRHRHRAAPGRLPVPVPDRGGAGRGRGQRADAERLGCDSRMSPRPRRTAQPVPRSGPSARCLVLPARRLRRPARVVAGYAAAAARAGGRGSAEHTEVLDISHRRRRRAPGHAPSGRSYAPPVVIAAGAWSTSSGRWSASTCRSSRPPPDRLHAAAGPARVRPSRSPSTCPRRCTSTTTATGCCSASPTGTRIRASAASSATAGPGPSTRPPRSSRPSLAGQQLVGGWAGLYENTPDHNALIGRPRSRLPVRHRVLRPRLPAGPGGRRDRPRPLPGPRAVHGSGAVQRRPVRRRRSLHEVHII